MQVTFRTHVFGLGFIGAHRVVCISEAGVVHFLWHFYSEYIGRHVKNVRIAILYIKPNQIYRSS